MNWLQKIAQNSGYLVPEMAPRRWTRWSERQEIVDQMRKSAQEDAQKLAEKNGHELSSDWNKINGNHCVKCGRQIYIRIGDWYDSLSGTKIVGPLTTEACHHQHGDIPFAVPDFRSQMVVEHAFPGSDDI